MKPSRANYKHSDPTHLKFGQSADSKLLAKRSYVAGGPVPDTDWKEEQRQSGERATEEGLFERRMEYMDKYGNPKDTELERNRGESIVKQPDDPGEWGEGKDAVEMPPRQDDA